MSDKVIRPSPEVDPGPPSPLTGMAVTRQKQRRESVPLRRPPFQRFGGFITGFISGAVAVALIWAAVAIPRGKSDQNTPEALLNTPRSSPTTTAATYTLPKKILSQADIAFGEQQVERMVLDRPEMMRYVKKSDPIWGHCVRAFAGEACGDRVYWNPTSPLGDSYRSDHLGPYQGDKGYIRVRKTYGSGFMNGEPLPCEELWACAVFELENIKSSSAFLNLYERALAGKMKRSEWVQENTRLEFGALLRTARDYEPLWKKTADARSIPTNQTLWFVNVPSRYEDWIAVYRDPKSYPWDSFGKYYDEEIVPYLRGLGR